MCGICGVLDFSGRALDPERIERMTASLAHRGPDDRGTWCEAPVMLGHRRLSIIDLSAAGHQPMQADGGRVTMVYNGEVYNFPELAAELEARGHRFRGRSDSEVVLHAWLEWGVECFARLNGMFALAIWDAARRELVLARDRFGIKPLHYHHEAGRLVFGSEIKALLAEGQVPRQLDWGFLHEYLWFGNSMGDQSAFAGIRKVTPGCFLRIDEQGVRETRFWDPRRLEVPEGDFDEHAAEVASRLEAAVKRHLLSDVPVAIFLSGGIDSSSIATYAARHHSGPLRTYTAGFEQGLDSDERPQAARLARKLGTDHRELQVRVEDMPRVIEELVAIHDEPFADAANVPLHLLCRSLADEGVKVVLQGDGGDEIFAGYRRYAELSRQRVWQLAARPGLAALAVLPASPRVDRVGRWLRVFAEKDPALRMALLLTVEDRADPPTRVLADAALAEVAEYDPFRAYRAAAALLDESDPVQRMLHTDCLVQLPDQFLAKVDRPTMAHGIEVRVPFLDAGLTDYVLPLPSRFKVKGLQKKRLLRRALRGTVPDEILDAPKRGFDVPYARWLRTDLAEMLRAVLLDPATGNSGLFRTPRVEKCIEEHVAGARDHGFLLYKLLHLALWQQRFLV